MNNATVIEHELSYYCYYKSVKSISACCLSFYGTTKFKLLKIKSPCRQQSKLKAYADNKVNVTKQLSFVIG